jgi:hypothetical protein
VKSHFMHRRIARLRQDPAVHRQPPTPQFLKTFKRERGEALGDEKGDARRETSEGEGNIDFC